LTGRAALLLIAALGAPAPGAEAPVPGYVGRGACAECHAKEASAWTGSDHARAMQPATPATVRGNFAGVTFRYGKVTSTFSRRGDAYQVRTDGPDGALHDYRVAYTFGVDPLQQYLIELPGGRLQALGIAWDTRPKSQGGQRWFHLYPDEKVDFRDVLHWTGPAQNWNHMCAECHSTGVEKNFRADVERFETRWAEVNVACEACHGPGAGHVAWARAEPRPADATKGLQALLDPGPGTWQLDGAAPIARLAGTRDTTAQIETCGRCHARRAEISEAWRAGQPLAQTHVVATLEDDLYFADGQIHDEVYEYGSFLQSRMYARGVACTDCHDPHTARLRAAGNAVCAPCHAPATYDRASHHHHREGTDAARCVSCHMPSRLYMVVDRRHDHGFRVPRPDQAQVAGTPDVCTGCHAKEKPAWAAERVQEWYGPTRSRGPAWTRALAAGRAHTAGGDAALAGLARAPDTPAIVRATALSLLATLDPPPQPELVARATADPDPLVRRAALDLADALPPEQRWSATAPLLGDAMRSVRIAAVSAAGPLPPSATPAERDAYERAVADYRAAQAFNADRADAWVNLAGLEARQGDVARAEADLQRAIRVQPSFLPASVNLADLCRAAGRDADGERVLRSALARHDDAAVLHHALGLLLVRTKRLDAALVELERAAALAPENPRYAYVYAIALDGVGQSARALRVLADAQRRFTGDRALVAALADLSARTGDTAAAARWRDALHALEPH